MELIVAIVDDTVIYATNEQMYDHFIRTGDERYCWTFDRDTGIEIDDLFGWGPVTGMSGSYLIRDAPETSE